jgi:hypothetical protein
MNPALLSTRDGNYDIFGTAADPLTSGAVYTETLEEWPGVVITHQPIEQSSGSITQPALGALIAGMGYFWKDTVRRALGNDIVAFERLYHNIPGDQFRRVSVSKNYQQGLYTFENGALRDIGIISFSRPINADLTYHYALDNPGSLPVIPFVQIIPWLRGQAITDLGTGFPHVPVNGINLPANNYASSFLDGGIISQVVGRLHCRKTLWG